MHKTKFKTRRITINLPAELLQTSLDNTPGSMTDMIVSALQLLHRSQAYDTLQQMKGKVHLKVDLKSSRERG